jgi:hypothetical protein
MVEGAKKCMTTNESFLRVCNLDNMISRCGAIYIGRDRLSYRYNQRN